MSRKNIEAVLQAAKARISPETSWLHLPLNGNLATSDLVEQTHLIPIWENALYSYALMRSHTVEQVQQSRTHLKRLLAYQIPSGEERGLFPSYVTDFPNAHDRVLQLQLLVLFKLFLKEGESLVGSDLKNILLDALHNLEHAIDRLEGNLSRTLQQVFACCRGIFEFQICQDAPQQELGLLVLAMLHFHPQYQEFVADSMELWAPNVGSVRLPSLRHHQYAGVTRKTLFDLVMRALYGCNDLLPKDQLTLETVLIPQIEPLSCTPPKSYECHTPFFSYSEMGKKFMWVATSWNPSEHDRTVFSPFHLMFPEWSMLISAPRATVLKVTCEGGVTLEFAPRSEAFVFDREAAPLFSIYWTHHPKGGILVDGEKANVVFAGSTVRVEMMGGGFEMKYVADESETCGHILRGNRPQELSVKGANRFRSYDWQFMVLPLRAPLPEKFSITISPFET